MEKGCTIPVGSDGGYVKLVDWMGSDHFIASAARTSFDNQNQPEDRDRDRNLLFYLMRHKHMSPFEMCEVVFEIKVPMDIWRQFVRHRTASINEHSTRYSEAIHGSTTTKSDEWRKQSKDNKQGSDGFLDSDIGVDLSLEELTLQKQAREVYENRIALGVAKEQARKDLPLCTFTRAFWKMDLRNLLHFLELRLDEHAQVEIRNYARAIYSIVSQLFPITMAAFEMYCLRAITFSDLELMTLNLLTNEGFCESVIKEQWSYARYLHGDDSHKASEGEYKEFLEKLRRIGCINGEQ